MPEGPWEHAAMQVAAVPEAPAALEAQGELERFLEPGEPAPLEALVEPAVPGAAPTPGHRPPRHTL